MIAKFESVSSKNLATLLLFTDGEENWVNIPQQDDQVMIVRVKAINPKNQGGGTWYELTLDIVEWVPKGDQPGQNRVDPKYLLKVYEILGQKNNTEEVSE